MTEGLNAGGRAAGESGLAAERQRIARELHDRMGYCLSMALRQLELYELHRGDETGVAEGYFRGAGDALRESMRCLRDVTTQLHPPARVGGLGEALRAYLESRGSGGTRVRVEVRGDEAWAPARVLDESFLVLREAACNALSHARPRTLSVDVTLTPDALRGTVTDDGRGFAAGAPGCGGGLGLAVMVERAELLGGRLTCASAPDEGTRVSLTVPLGGCAVEYAG